MTEYSRKEYFDGPLGLALSRYIDDKMVPSLDPYHEKFIGFPELYPEDGLPPMAALALAECIDGLFEIDREKSLKLKNEYGLSGHRITALGNFAPSEPFMDGFGDLGFFACSSVNIALEIQAFLRVNSFQIGDRLNLGDTSRIVRSPWFKDIINHVAFTTPFGKGQILGSTYSIDHREKIGNDLLRSTTGVRREELLAIEEREDGKMQVVIAEPARKDALRQRREGGIDGCPVSRNSFSMKYADYQQVTGSAQDGWKPAKTITQEEGSMSVIPFGSRETGIHRLVDAWGKYIWEYGEQLTGQRFTAMTDEILGLTIDDRIALN